MIEASHKFDVAAVVQPGGSAMNESTTSDSRHPRPFPPPWANSWGDDRYGLWAQFELQVERQSVQQRMRWIEPGEFLMGGAEDEANRHENAPSQYPVIISQGFWLADTACTQVLWQMLINDIPNYSSQNNGDGPENPVERVSWNRVQWFLQILQKSLPACHATLPTEAEWEYACRAGSETPLSFGANRATDQENFNGNFPYAEGPAEQNLPPTLPVKALPANPWGLYQMQGNVREFCVGSEFSESTDISHDPGLAQALQFVLGPLGPDWFGVARGGYINSVGESTRSSSRYFPTPNAGDSDFGFRFVFRQAGNGIPHDFLDPQERAQTEGRGDPFTEWSE